MLESDEVVSSPISASILCTLNMSSLCSPNSLSMVFLMSPSQYIAIAMSRASGHRLSTVCACTCTHVGHGTCIGHTNFRLILQL